MAALLWRRLQIAESELGLCESKLNEMTSLLNRAKDETATSNRQHQAELKRLREVRLCTWCSSYVHVQCSSTTCTCTFVQALEIAQFLNSYVLAIRIYCTVWSTYYTWCSYVIDLLASPAHSCTMLHVPRLSDVCSCVFQDRALTEAKLNKEIMTLNDSCTKLENKVGVIQNAHALTFYEPKMANYILRFSAHLNYTHAVIAIQ